MRSPLRVLVLVALAVALLPAARAGAATPGDCQEGTFASGALWRFCKPAQGWNGQLIIYAHGYVRPGQPLDFQNQTLPGGPDLAVLAQTLGYAFATTSYRQNGLAILEGMDDVADLVAAAPIALGAMPQRTYLIGVSEGGLVATLLAERSPQQFDGVLAACAPIGDFRRQIDYFGDFRVLFDYFFPGVIPPSPISVPQSVIDAWEAQGGGAAQVAAALSSNQAQAAQLLSTAAASIGSPITAANALDGTLGVLSYNIYSTNDAAAKLGGNPYDNNGRMYAGSSNDAKLNQNVPRFDAAQAALDRLAQYQTSGDSAIPLVTIHTTGDEIVPFWHEALYRAKAQAAGRRPTQIAIERAGHCNFTPNELLAAFGLVVRPNRAYLPLAIR
jgi:pimeloyl-ACP methyl ester carboxylesterase